MFSLLTNYIFAGQLWPAGRCLETSDIEFVQILIM